LARTVIIIGAGPAGLTAAYELLTRTDIKPVILERSQAMGGLSRTVNYNGNRMDIGGHRFFTKSDRVMDWWLEHLPIAPSDGGAEITYRRRGRRLPGESRITAANGDAMLVRPRKSRIYFLRQFFDYPIRLNGRTLRQLGPWRMVRIGASYARSVCFPRRPVVSLEDFFIRRFGRELYRTFFQSYTEKVWGLPCSEISAAWGEQRVKGLSGRTAAKHFLRQLISRHPAPAEETSLIEQFLYPRLGPGQLWEKVAEKVVRLGGEIVTEAQVTRLRVEGKCITAVETADGREFRGDEFFSTMAVQELVAGMTPAPPAEIQNLAAGLQYRDFITVGLLVRHLKVGPITDNWIYIQEPGVLAGRLQIFNNWSPAMVRDPENTVWLGVEYFCQATDPLWKLDDADMAALAASELAEIGILDSSQVLDATVVRMPKTYPGYFGPAYARFGELRAYLDQITNLHLMGRNGMHKYNNQDHSMLTAMMAVDNLVAGNRDRSNLWGVNTEEAYHESDRRTEDRMG